MSAYRISIFGLIIALGLALTSLAQAEMIVETKSGQTFRLPITSDQLKAIHFGDGTDTAQSVPPPAVRPPVIQPGGKAVLTIWNRGGCSLTDTSEFQLSGKLPITGLVTWRKWSAGESSVDYQLFKDDRLIYSGSFSRGNCDSHQPAWCEGISRLKGSLGAGRYQVKVADGGICRNQDSGTGFIRVYSFAALPAGPAGANQGGSSRALGKYTRTPNAAISGHNLRHVSQASPADCARACDNEPWCVSFDYYKKERGCDLSDRRASDVGGLKTDYAGNPYDHYSKN